MKKILCAGLLFLAMSSSLSAQTGVRFGFRGGYSMATQYGIIDPALPYDVGVRYRHGLAGGILLYYPVTESFGIQQEFLYVQKGSRHDIIMLDQPVETYPVYDINYFELPILFRYKFVRLGSVTLYGCSGFALSILLNGHYDMYGSIEIDGEKASFSESSKIRGVDIFDYAFLYGSGAEFTLFRREFFFEYRFTIGWNTLMMPTFEGEDPAPLRNQNYIFTMGMYL